MFKRNLLYGLLVGLFVISTAFSQKETKTVSKTIKPYSGKSFSLKNAFGDVIVTGTDKNEVSIVAKISSEIIDAKKIVNDIDIRIDESSSSIDVETIIPEYLKNNKIKNGSDIKSFYKDKEMYRIDYVISVPKSVYLTIDNSFGKTNIKDISNKVDVKNTFGELNIKNCTSSNQIKSEFGSIVLKNIGGGSDITNNFGEVKIDVVSGDISISSEFGDFKVNDVTGSVKVKTSFSNVSLENIKGDVEVKEDGFSNISTKKIGGTIRE